MSNSPKKHKNREIDEASIQLIGSLLSLKYDTLNSFIESKRNRSLALLSVNFALLLFTLDNSLVPYLDASRVCPCMYIIPVALFITILTIFIISVGIVNLKDNAMPFSSINNYLDYDDAESLNEDAVIHLENNVKSQILINDSINKNFKRLLMATSVYWILTIVIEIAIIFSDK